MNRLLSHCLVIAVLLALAWASTGCKSAETENASSRPWNTPRGFDSGLPGYDPGQFR